MNSSEELKLKFAGYPNHILNGFQKFFDDEELCDFSIFCEDKEFHVHKALLAIVSDYFRALFRNDMKERSENCVHLLDLSSAGLSRIIRFIYTGELVISSNEEVAETLFCASRLQIKSAIDICTQYLADSLKIDNAVSTFLMAGSYQLTKLHEISLSFILHHFTQIINLCDFQTLDLSEMINILRHNALECVTEYELFHPAAQWISAHENLNCTYEVMKCIRFPLMSPEELLDLQCHSLVADNPDCMRLINFAKEYHFLRHIPRKRAIINHRCTQVRNKPSVVALHQSNGISCLLDQNWLKIINTAPNSQHYGLCSVNNFLYICGGFVEGTGVTNLCCMFDPRFMELKPIATMNEPRMGFPLVAVGLQLYAVGGNRACVADGSNSVTVECFSVADDQWTLSGRLPAAAEKHAACELGGRVFVTGGCSPDNGRLSSACWAFNPATVEWVSFACMNSPHFQHSMFSYADRLYVVDARNAVVERQVEYFSPADNQWTSVTLTASLVSPLDNCIAQMGQYIYLLSVSGQLGVESGEARTFRLNVVTFEVEELGNFHAEKLRSAVTLGVLTLPQHVVPVIRELRVHLHRAACVDYI